MKATKIEFIEIDGTDFINFNLRDLIEVYSNSIWSKDRAGKSEEIDFYSELDRAIDSLLNACNSWIEMDSRMKKIKESFQLNLHEIPNVNSIEGEIVFELLSQTIQQLVKSGFVLHLLLGKTNSFEE